MISAPPIRGQHGEGQPKRISRFEQKSAGQSTPQQALRPMSSAMGNLLSSWSKNMMSGWSLWFSWPLWWSRQWLSATPLQASLVQFQGFTVTENDQEVIVLLEIPDLVGGKLDARIEDNVLRVQGERNDRAKGDEFHMVYDRKVTLPAPFPLTEAKTSYRDGVLEVRIPKPEAMRGKKLEDQKGAAKQERDGAGEHRNGHSAAERPNGRPKAAAAEPPRKKRQPARGQKKPRTAERATARRRESKRPAKRR